jgi:RecJ-like exonuclease
LFGVNKEILKDAESTGKMRVSKGLRLWGRTRRPIHKALEYSVDPYIPGISGSESGAVHFLQELGIVLRDENGAWKTLSGLTSAEMKKLTTGIIKERIRENHENPEWIFGEVYDLLDKDELKDANEFATILNSAGKQDMGYVGIALCLNNKEYFPMVEKMLEKYRREIGKSLRWVEKNPGTIRRTEHANYVLAGSKIPETIISNVVSIMHRSDMLPESEKGKPVFALVNAENGGVKVSARVSDAAVERGLSLQDVLSEAVKVIGGEGGGHAGAAGASLPGGSEETFINSIEEILKKFNSDKDKKVESEVIENGTAKSARREDCVRDTVRPEGGADGEAGHGAGQGSQGEAKAIVKPQTKKEAKGEGLVRYLSS